METIIVLLQLVLAGVLAVAAVGKFRDLAGSRQAVRDFGVPDRFTKLLGTALPIGELGLAILLLFGPTARWAALLAGLLFLVFIAAIGWNLRQGRQPDCHCFGQIHSEPAGWSTIIRNSLLTLAAAIIVIQGSQGIAEWFDDMSSANQAMVLLSTAILAVLVVLGFLLRQLLEQGKSVIARLESLDAKDFSGVAATGPTAEVIANPAPAFDIPSVDGSRMSLQSLLEPGKPLFLLFTDPNCGPCNALMPDMAEWQRRFGDELTIGFISRGSVEANQEKNAQFGFAHVGLQERFEISESYEVQGTPSAVLIQPDGVIRDPIATGRDDIRELISRATSTLSPESEQRHKENLRNRSLDFEPDNPLDHLPVALAVGEPAPRAPLPDLDGEYVSIDDLRGQETVVLFWSPTCSFCQRMLPDLKEWEQESDNADQHLLIVSSGSVEENRALGLESRIVIDDGFTAGSWVGVAGTPSAILIDAEGRIAAPLVLGADSVLDLLYSQTETDDVLEPSLS